MNPLRFTDESLKALKDDCEAKKWQKTIELHPIELQGLINRLEAAETTIIDLLIICDLEENKERIMRATLPWNIAAGRCK